MGNEYGVYVNGRLMAYCEKATTKIAKAFWEELNCERGYVVVYRNCYWVERNSFTNKSLDFLKRLMRKHNILYVYDLPLPKR